MKGDYHRYLAEFATGNTRSTSSEASLEACPSPLVGPLAVETGD